LYGSIKNIYSLRKRKQKNARGERTESNATTAAELGMTTGSPVQPDVGERALHRRHRPPVQL